MPSSTPPDTSNRLGIRTTVQCCISVFAGGLRVPGTRYGLPLGNVCLRTNTEHSRSLKEKDEENDAFRSGRKLLSIFVPGWRFGDHRRYELFVDAEGAAMTRAGFGIHS